MNRYIWSMNGVPLSETDKIKINDGEVTRITLNNLTMMHHPMHLHGHFFRVINKNGEYSPLKHTVNVPPMQEVTIEFSGNNGDEIWRLVFSLPRLIPYDERNGKSYKLRYHLATREWNLFPVTKLIKRAIKFVRVNGPIGCRFAYDGI